MSEQRPMQVWSCGGGTQSVAIAALIVKGQLPKPDHSLIVDTTRERSSTWAYYETVLLPALAPLGVNVVRVNRDDYSDVDLYGGEDGKTLMLPVFTVSPSTKLGAFCSGEWKRDVAMRYMRNGLGLKTAVMWIGYSTDEMRRVSTPRRQWCQLRYPLIEDVPMTRDRCKALVRSMGWPPPPRSSCYMCPNHSNSEWREMRDHQPDDFAKAVQIEREFRVNDPDKFLHPSRVPLDQVDLSEEAGLFTGHECTGTCFT